jgi:predicted transcriptional regulator
MARPKHDQPTPAELELLKVLWEEHPLSVREVMEQLADGRERAYTSVMSLLNVMTEKKLLKREAQGRAFVYRPAVSQKKTLGRMVHDLLGRAYAGSTESLVAHLLDQSKPSAAELEEIRSVIDRYEQERGS